MKLCDDGHEEIVYDDNNFDKCPLCTAIANCDELTDTKTELEDELHTKDKEISHLESELDDANNRINNLTGEG